MLELRLTAGFFRGGGGSSVKILDSSPCSRNHGHRFSHTVISGGGGAAGFEVSVGLVQEIVEQTSEEMVTHGTSSSSSERVSRVRSS